ncbi:unnamed protein product [Cylicocyclus nassatus]|uniref:FBA domain-containing protein n=1 Tax=Cylicocyclus nassatus TaxID=53992 RepID=A0AA36DP56_CYLNA|nr:unnamed protein product [Cylicocyclus nassatus]
MDIKEAMRDLFIIDLFTKYGNNQQKGNFCADGVLWFEILKRCDNNSLLRAELTCQLFHRILSSSQFWIEKCEYDGVALPSIQWRKYLYEKEYSKSSDPYSNGIPLPHVFDYKRICIGRPFGRNIAVTLGSHCTLDSLKQKGMRFKSGGNGIIIERPPEGIDSDEISICFTTSYGWCSRYFEIDLNKAGVQDWIMDLIRPEITVRERCICRRDCEAIYELQVKLLKEHEEFDASEDYEKLENSIYPRFRTAKRSWAEEKGKSWELVEYMFEDYPAGIRRIGVLSRGKDSRYWAGHYGSKFGATEVRIKLPDNPRMLALDEAVDAWSTYVDC